MIRVPGMLFSLLLASLPAFADDSPARAFPPEVQARLQAVLSELQSVEEKLRPIRRRAERGEALTETKNEIQRDVLEEVERRSGDVSARVARIETLQAELAENGSPEIRRELNSLKDELEPIVREVRDLPNFRERIEAYEDRLEAAMIEDTPEAEELIARRDALHIQFNRLQREALEGVRGEEIPEADDDRDSPLEWITPPSRRR